MNQGCKAPSCKKKKKLTIEGSLATRTRLGEPTPQPPSPPPIPSPSPIYSLRRRKPRPSRHRRSLCCRRGPGGAAATFIVDLQVAVGTPRQRFATAAVEFREGHDPREIFVGVAAAADVACRREERYGAVDPSCLWIHWMRLGGVSAREIRSGCSVFQGGFVVSRLGRIDRCWIC
ncbi:hypothetical protein VPH35_137929 [Triticum aestivum]